MSLIACDKGKFDEATLWLSRALEFNDDELDVNICLGDLYSRGGFADDAKRCYEKMMSKVSISHALILSHPLLPLSLNRIARSPEQRCH